MEFRSSLRKSPALNLNPTHPKEHPKLHSAAVQLRYDTCIVKNAVDLNLGSQPSHFLKDFELAPTCVPHPICERPKSPAS